MSTTNQCQKCKQYIFGDYCCNCQEYISNFSEKEENDIFNFFGIKNPFNFKNKDE